MFEAQIFAIAIKSKSTVIDNREHRTLIQNIFSEKFPLIEIKKKKNHSQIQISHLKIFYEECRRV